MKNSFLENKYRVSILSFLLLLLFFVPIFFVNAQVAGTDGSGLVPCTDMCTVKNLFELIANVVKFLLFTVAVPLCTLMIAYGGIQIATSSTNPGGKDKGKGIVTAALVGLLIALSSYLIVDTVLDLFTGQSVDTLEKQIK